MIEPMAWIGADAFEAISGGETVQPTLTPSKVCEDDVPLVHVPAGYALVKVEPTDAWIAKMREGTVEPQGMDAQARIIENLRRQYRKMIEAAKGE